MSASKIAIRRFISVASLIVLATGIAAAQNFPNHPIRFNWLLDTTRSDALADDVEAQLGYLGHQGEPALAQGARR